VLNNTPAQFKPLANRSQAADGSVTYAMPADGFVQLVPKGRAPNVLGDGTPIMQVVDDAALQAMFNRAVESGMRVLVDDEHFSHDIDKGTDANAWAPFTRETLQLREDGLYGKLDMTPKGLHNVTTGQKMFISPEFPPPPSPLVELISKGVYRPLAVTGFGLTNRPAFRQYAKPLANRDINTNPQTDTMLKPLVAALFGITETALDALDEATLKNRFKSFADAASDADTAKKELGELKNRAADEFITQHDAVIPKDDNLRKHLRTTFIGNRDVATSLVDGFKAAKKDEDPTKARGERTPLFNRDAKTPTDAEKQDTAARQRGAAIKNRAQALCDTAKAGGRKLNWDDAWKQAEAEIA
jgi:phage I-like protein